MKCTETTTFGEETVECELDAPHPTSSHFAPCADGGAFAWGEAEWVPGPMLEDAS